MRAARPRALMVQGTGSDVGKSVLVAGLARAYARRGLKVAPFKPQNMSNNAAVTAEGGEIGRAQALQARAAGIAPSVHMNPVLLKPESDRGSQVVIQGRAEGRIEAGAWRSRRARFLPAILDSFATVGAGRDLVLVEGAGSAAEVNLRAGDVANMGFAEAAGLPVVLAGDIDRGGVIAALVGTAAVLSPPDAARIRGFLVNKFRGDPALFADGMDFVAGRTGWHPVGVLPWLPATARLPAEDAVRLERPVAGRGGDRPPVSIAVPMLSRIANFDDLDPLLAEPAVSVAFVPPGRPLPRDADAIVLPGTKSTRGDLAMLREQGWDIDIIAHRRAGGRVLGLCGGLQLLGRRVDDPQGSDGAPGSSPGLGLLDVATAMAAQKVVREAQGIAPDYGGAAVRGYEIHMGATEGPDAARPLVLLDGRPDGARSADGRVEGSYLHGLFGSDGFRAAWLESLRAGTASGLPFEAGVDAALDEIAEALEAHLDLDGLLALAEEPGWSPRP
ncbi:cobyric acid synthase [Marinibaculum pumilum]|uniref:Cobyric acid synthase n=1 Tax=Marinibaculum pumilum TaxID=1766165 RepID=A0ABV7L814_9PROT